MLSTLTEKHEQTKLDYTSEYKWLKKDYKSLGFKIGSATIKQANSLLQILLEAADPRHEVGCEADHVGPGFEPLPREDPARVRDDRQGDHVVQVHIVQPVVVRLQHKKMGLMWPIDQILEQKVNLWTIIREENRPKPSFCYLELATYHRKLS